MPTIYVYDTWNSLVFGDNGTDPITYGLISSTGLEDVANRGEALSGGFGGTADSALWPNARSWTTVLDLSAAPGDDWQTLLDDLRAATADVEVHAYVMSKLGTTYTIYAKVDRRQLPRDRDAIESGYGEGQLVFVASDPVIYGDATTATFTGGSDTDVIDSPGWVGSERWVWTVPGPCTNPQISSDFNADAVVRYSGTIASGSNLVVELLPRGQVPGFYAKIVTDADLATYQTTGVGTAAYGSLDGGASGVEIPQWFPVVPGEQTLTFSCTSGTPGCTFVWRAGYN